MSKLTTTTRRIVGFRWVRPAIDLALLLTALFALIALRNMEIEQQLNQKPNLQIQQSVPVRKTLFLEQQFNTEADLWQTWSTWINTKQPDSGQCLVETKPIDSGCQCRCTKTRCSCHCQNAGNWISPASCLDNNPNCTSQNAQTDCTSLANQPCTFNGPARMKNLWPVSHFEPIAAINKSCRPIHSNQCPLSQNSTACTCHFSWPDNTLPSLNQFSFKLTGTP